jgi:hypothetical protein
MTIQKQCPLTWADTGGAAKRVELGLNAGERSNTCIEVFPHLVTSTYVGSWMRTILVDIGRPWVFTSRIISVLA